MIYALLSKIVASRIYAILWAKSLRMPGLGGGGVNLIQAMPEFWEHLDRSPLPNRVRTNEQCEDPSKHIVSIGNHEKGMKNAFFSPLTMK